MGNSHPHEPTFILDARSI